MCAIAVESPATRRLFSTRRVYSDRRRIRQQSHEAGKDGTDDAMLTTSLLSSFGTTPRWRRSWGELFPLTDGGVEPLPTLVDHVRDAIRDA